MNNPKELDMCDNMYIYKYSSVSFINNFMDNHFF